MKIQMSSKKYTRYKMSDQAKRFGTSNFANVLLPPIISFRILAKYKSNDKIYC